MMDRSLAHLYCCKMESIARSIHCAEQSEEGLEACPSQTVKNAPPKPAKVAPNRLHCVIDILITFLLSLDLKSLETIRSKNIVSRISSSLGATNLKS